MEIHIALERVIFHADVQGKRGEFAQFQNSSMLQAADESRLHHISETLPCAGSGQLTV